MTYEKGKVYERLETAREPMWFAVADASWGSSVAFIGFEVKCERENGPWYVAVVNGYLGDGRELHYGNMTWSTGVKFKAKEDAHALAQHLAGLVAAGKAVG